MIVAVLGAGGHGHDIAAIAASLDLAVCFCDDGRGSVYPFTRLVNDHPFVVGVNDPATKRRLAAVGSNPVTLVSPTATVAATTSLAPGCVIGAGTNIGPDVTLGEHVHVGAGVTITRTTVGAFTTIAPGVDIAGDVTIGEECLIGVGAVISNLVSIGDRVTVGAGAVVVSDVPSGVTVAGVPAKPLQRREQA